ncbi:aromatic-ring-hydroxylating dioxygenase subunit beta [Novosphingobium album (ex Liu et al. 2023)]|uniref:aromatic-ring-hydroxylating dioxygenase subunit beta n=1 Tax=Novosphingobium album (ex Liu et al. 2023) TaxID=3031130 RepID=UPI0023AF7D8D|nr:nuclear transport factor 2 family protein [Novosphingobium album (ex Liu et al. 2023)]
MRAELEDWYANYAEIIDDKRPNDWVSSFAETGVYAVGTHNNVSTTGAWWYTDHGVVYLKERAAYNGGYFWHTPQRTLLMISNILAQEEADGKVVSRAAFAMFAADRHQASQVHVTGRYSDVFVRQEGRLVFAEHRAVIDGETVPANMGVFL